jgi:TRAP-type C4-dicarboxylate transport system substrate-binding protein
MTPITTRRALLAGGTMLLAGRAPAQQQATTLKLYSAVYEIEAAIEQFIGFDALTAELRKERAAGGEHALLDGVHKGALDLTTIASVSATGHYPEMEVFDVPFMFRDYAHARAVLDGPIGRDLLAKTPSGGPLLLACSENGFRHLTNNTRPVRTPEDVKGLKLRTPKSPVMIEAFRTLGAEVTPTPWSQAIFDALAQGTLNAQENTINTIWSTQIFMSRAAYDRLSDADKEAFVESARQAGELKRKSISDSEDMAIAQLLSVGMKINTDVDKAAFRAALAPAYAKWRQQFGDLIERIQAHA